MRVTCVYRLDSHVILSLRRHLIWTSSCSPGYLLVLWLRRLYFFFWALRLIIFCSNTSSIMTAMPSFDENAIHSVEFEAPISTESGTVAGRHFSIDLSLELERQLDMEAYPPTPPPDGTESDSRQDSSSGTGVPKHQSLDPHVLAHIIQQLRQSLSEVTKERDELQQAVASSSSQEAEMKDSLQLITEKAKTMEVELDNARQKIRDDEDAIGMLRTKVEESR